MVMSVVEHHYKRLWVWFKSMNLFLMREAVRLPGQKQLRRLISKTSPSPEGGNGGIFLPPPPHHTTDLWPLPLLYVLLEINESHLHGLLVTRWGLVWGVGGRGRMGTRRVSANGPEGSDGGRGVFSNDSRNVWVRRTSVPSLTKRGSQRRLQKEETSFGFRRERTDIARARFLMAPLLTKRSWPSFLLGVSTHSLLQAFKLLTCQPPKDYIHVCVRVCVFFFFLSMYVQYIYIYIYVMYSTRGNRRHQYINGCKSEPPTSRKRRDIIWLTSCPHCVIHLANHPEA